MGGIRFTGDNKRSKPGDDEEEGRIMALPIDIMIIIFLKLLIKPLLCCQCVCNLWRKTINSSFFVDRHRTSSAGRESQLILFKYFQGETLSYKSYAVAPEISSNTFTLSRYPIDEFTPKSVVIHNLGHGLFLLGPGIQPNDNPGVLYNPIRQQKLVLPPSTIDKVEFDRSTLYTHGLCFNKSNNQYKLVCVSAVANRLRNPYRDINVTEVYTLGGPNEWKQITATFPRLLTRVKGLAGTPAYGDTHWIAYRDVVSFGILNQEFKVTPIPVCIPESIASMHLDLFTWREELAILDQPSPNTIGCDMGIWVLRDYDNNSSSKWEKLHAINFPLLVHIRDFVTWEDGIVFDIGGRPWSENNKRIGRNCRKLLYWNTKEGVLTAKINKSPSLRIKSRPHELFTSYTVNLISLARPVPEDST